ncbi:MAG: Mitochondrial distribution and morphology protein 10 [Cirrosporium novae-zelandiae]|nr:MAG: Mitochondrial distribution and morphology protein 10 [Cirrosporium novae-zelandiae]
MLPFMDYIQNAFYTATSWNRQNSYGTLEDTSRSLLDFPTPHGLNLHLSSLSTPNFATSYTLHAIGPVTGSISYLYSSISLSPSPGTLSSTVPLPALTSSYKSLRAPVAPAESWEYEIWHRGRRVDKASTLLYGRVFLPHSTLEALYLHRLSPANLLRLSAVSDTRLRNGGTILALLQHDTGKYTTEYLYSTDSALFGIRGLYNFGPDPLPAATTALTSNDTIPPPSLLSAGAEFYYSPLNSSGGLSTGLRFTTLPSHPGFPYTMTLTLNPLMGNLTSTYAVRASRNLSLCSRFAFNLYSYESSVQLGMELFRRHADPYSPEQLGWAFKKLNKRKWDGDAEKIEAAKRDRERWVREGYDASGVLKARIDQVGRIGVLWEGRAKDLLFSCGVSVELKRRERMLGNVGLEVQYSS